MGAYTRLTSDLLFLNSLFVFNPATAMVILDFVEGSGECVEKPSTKVNKKHSIKGEGEDLRADDGQDECTPGQVA